jgi:dsDNA-binding SOS-regulon protein
MKIKRVASYETTDGQVFADKKAAQAHQKTVDRLTQLQKMIAEAFSTSDDNPHNAYLEEVTVATLAAFLLDNADELRAILPQRAKPDADGFVAGLKEGLKESLDNGAKDPLLAEAALASLTAKTPATVQ